MMFFIVPSGYVKELMLKDGSDFQSVCSPKGAVNWMAIILLCFAWDFDSLAEEVLKVL